MSISSDEEILKLDPPSEDEKEEITKNKNSKKRNKNKNKNMNSSKIVDNNIKYPWVQNSNKIENTEIKLHYEIMEFYEYIKPKNKDMEIRKNIVNRIKKFIKVIFL